MKTKIKFGFSLPLFANPGMLFFRTPNYTRLGWDDLLETTLRCEQLGYDSVFVADHLFLGHKGEIWECIATMSALAAKTTTMEIIPIHLCNNFRNPAITAKTLTTLNHISKGRLTLFYDYGWREAEFKSYGVDFCHSDEDRINQMSEGLEIIKGMFQNEHFSYQGKYYQVDDAINTPAPLGNIDIWMGETNHPKMVESIVKHADYFNSMPCSIDEFRQKKKILEEECFQQGRDFSKIKYSFETQVLIRETAEEIDELFEELSSQEKFNDSFDADIIKQLKEVNPEMSGYKTKEDYQDQFIIGTPEVVKAKIDEYINQGVEHFMLWFMDYPNRKGIEIFADKVMNQFNGKE